MYEVTAFDAEGVEIKRGGVRSAKQAKKWGKSIGATGLKVQELDEALYSPNGIRALHYIKRQGNFHKVNRDTFREFCTRTNSYMEK